MSRSLDTYARALRILTGRDHGTAELRRKLRDKGCVPDEVEAAIERLTAAGYLDDHRVVANEVERLVDAGSGPLLVRSKLARRGFARDTVDAAVGQIADERWRASCAAALRRRFDPHAAAVDRTMRLKAARFLAGRGFSREHVRRVLDGFEED